MRPRGHGFKKLYSSLVQVGIEGLNVRKLCWVHPLQTAGPGFKSAVATGATDLDHSCWLRWLRFRSR